MFRLVTHAILLCWLPTYVDFLLCYSQMGTWQFGPSQLGLFFANFGPGQNYKNSSKYNFLTFRHDYDRIHDRIHDRVHVRRLANSIKYQSYFCSTDNKLYWKHYYWRNSSRTNRILINCALVSCCISGWVALTTGGKKSITSLNLKVLNWQLGSWLQ